MYAGINFDEQPIIAAVRTEEDFHAACGASPEVIFLLSSAISDIARLAATAHREGKRLFLHIDLADGVGKDAEGVRYVASLGVDGIITTRASTVRHAKECGIACVQRFFMVDSHSVDTALDAIRSVHPDMIEIMPAIATKTIGKLRRQTAVPIIAGGLIEEKDEIIAALGAGADAVSTGKRELWALS